MKGKSAQGGAGEQVRQGKPRGRIPETEILKVGQLLVLGILVWYLVCLAD